MSSRGSRRNDPDRRLVVDTLSRILEGVRTHDEIRCAVESAWDELVAVARTADFLPPLSHDEPVITWAWSAPILR